MTEVSNAGYLEVAEDMPQIEVPVDGRFSWEQEKGQAAAQNRPLNWDLYYPNASEDAEGKIIYDPQGRRVPDESRDKKSKKAAEEAHKSEVETANVLHEMTQNTAKAATPDLNAEPEPEEEVKADEEVVEVEPEEFDDLVESGELVDVQVEDEKK